MGSPKMKTSLEPIFGSQNARNLGKEHKDTRVASISDDFEIVNHEDAKDQILSKLAQ